jgi:hypothetical protein
MNDTTGPSSSGEKDAAAARTAHCIPPACGIYFYEVEIVSKGQKGYVVFGAPVLPTPFPNENNNQAHQHRVIMSCVLYLKHTVLSIM